MQDVASSPDLTETDRSHLIQIYLANFQQEKENHNQVTDTLNRSRASATRGKSKHNKVMSTTSTIQKTATLADGAGLKTDEKAAVKQSLFQMSRHWKDIPHLRGQSGLTKLSGNLLNEQLAILRTFQSEKSPPPEALAKTINFAAFQQT